MIQKFIKLVTGSSSEERRAELYRNLIRHEAQIGGKLFGPIPEGGKREFFCLDEHTWVWYEEWTDENGQRKSKTTRYDVRPSSILKSIDGGPQQLITPQEARHLQDATHLYQKKVRSELYAKL